MRSLLEMEILSDVDCSCVRCVSPATVMQCLCCACPKASGLCGQAVDHCCACCCSSLCQCCHYSFGRPCSSCADSSHIITCATILILLLVMFCLTVGVSCLAMGAMASRAKECGTYFSVHLVVLGCGILIMACFFLRVFLQYTRKVSTESGHQTAAFHAFWQVLKLDIVLALLLLGTALTVLWAFAGLVWLSNTHCAAEQQEKSLVIFASVSVIILGVSTAVWTVFVFTLVSCDEGSCSYSNYGVTCFLCCCLCCLKPKAGFHSHLSKHCQSVRSIYPPHRSVCLAIALKTLVGLGFLRRGYAESRYRTREESRVEILQSQVVPEMQITGKPL